MKRNRIFKSALLGGVMIWTTLAVRSATTIVAFGDSTTAARGDLMVYATVVKAKLEQSGHAVDVINAGVPSNTTADAKARFEHDVLAKNPDIVVVQFGINDAAIDVWKTPPATASRVSRSRFVANLTEMITRMNTAGIKVILMTPNPTRWTDKMREKYGHPPYDPNTPAGFSVFLSHYAEDVRAVAQSTKVNLIDIYAEYEGTGAVEALLLDGVHPNQQGHQLVGRLVAWELLEHWVEWFN